MISLSAERVAREVRRASECEAAHKAWAREHHRAFWQSAAIAFLGAPLYAWGSWYLTDPDQIRLARACAYCVTYVGPWIRLLVFHLRRADQE
jgi:hypothetical protein